MIVEQIISTNTWQFARFCC